MGYNRTASATETQALKYSDILQMVNNATKIGGKGGRGMLRGSRRKLPQVKGENADANAETDEEDNRPKKKAKMKARRSSAPSPPPRGSKKDHDEEDSDNEGPVHRQNLNPAVKAAFNLKFTKSKAQQFNIGSIRN